DHKGDLGSMRVRELADAADSPTKTLRYYDALARRPPPDRAPNGYRDHPEAMHWRLDFNHRGQRAGPSLGHSGEHLRMLEPGHALLATPLTELDQQIADLSQLRHTVTALHHTSRAADPATCHAEAICTNL